MRNHMRDAPTKVNDDRHSSSAATAVNNKQPSIIDWNPVIGKIGMETQKHNTGHLLWLKCHQTKQPRGGRDIPTLSWSAYVLPQTTITMIPTTRRLKRQVIFFMSVFCSFQANQWKNHLYHPVRYANIQRHLSTLRKCNNQLHHQYHDMAAVLSCGQNRRSAGRSLPTTFCLFVRSSLAALSLSRWVRCRWRWRVGPGLFFPCRLRRGTHQTVVHSSRAFFRRERRPVI
jgi:hypothetical protein